MLNDTIAAIATPPGVGGIGVIRVSGNRAFEIVRQLLRRSKQATHLPSPFPSHRLTYMHIFDPVSGEFLDEALVAFMHAPRTYTYEDVVEIQAHGGPLVLQRVLRTVLTQGARLANPGEFTLRAFLNGRLDLSQAEAVMDLISAQTEAGQRLALEQLRGSLSEQIQDARHAILGVIARIEASIDFPEEDVPTPLPDDLCPLIALAQFQVDQLLTGADRGRLYREGISTAIIGRPNVGKSSLLNALLHAERAIVTPIAGTTRDTVEETINLHGIPLRLIDTAGITSTDDPVEQIGVQRSRAAAESADIVLFVFDGSECLTEQDCYISSELQALGFGAQAVRQQRNSPQSRSVFLVVNKLDQEQHIDISKLSALWPLTPIVSVSTLTGTGLDTLESTIADSLLEEKTFSSESTLVTNVRHQEALRRSSEHLQASVVSLEQCLPLDFASIDLRAAYDELGKITGETASEDLLDKIFSEFCIGK